MRSYIFTPKEREVIHGYFEGRVGLGDDIMRQIVVRLRSFRNLAGDVELYLRLREAVSTAST
ncbi:MAG: hypothetical protein QW587_07790 [Candidatus Bathyarchaeia archaeon]